MSQHDLVYSTMAERYEQLISREDYQGNIPKILNEIINYEGLHIVDIGAGTGRLTCMLAPKAEEITALDSSSAMLEVTEQKLKQQMKKNWSTKISDIRTIPLPNNSVDVVTAGWSICYVGNTNIEGWEHNVKVVIDEAKRVLKSNGVIIIFETFGTGNEEPHAPDFLSNYYSILEDQYGFSHKWIRTDYKFEDVGEAEHLTRFFFGDWIADRIVSENLTVLPECTGVWWLQIKE